MKNLKLLCLFMVICLLAGCASSAVSLTKEIKAEDVESKAADNEFKSSQMDFSAELFKKVSLGNKNENIHISPLSVSAALAMTVNGARENTKSEMEAMWQGITSDRLNQYYLWWHTDLISSGELRMANSLWFQDNEYLKVDNGFLQNTVNYYGAEIFKTVFDDNAQKQLNKWVRKNTDGMIKEMEFDKNSAMCLVNAVAFDAKWETPYEKYSVHEGTFTNLDQSKSNVEMMSSKEEILLRDTNATGFIKNYKGEKYGFAALLPNEDVDIYDYIETLDGDRLTAILNNKITTYTEVQIPKFTLDYKTELNDALIDMGMKDAFDPIAADLSGMGSAGDVNLYVGKVIHKTHITLNESGTKAAASTMVCVDAGSAMVPPSVILNRPFVFMIIDHGTGLPVFMGVITELK
ncbi:MAG: serpin family protein [Clostridia bacterium]|nr:serpin family protein [Clostridia bacterium]